MNEKFDFLFSTRFWALILTSASTILIDPSFGSEEWYKTLGKFLGMIGGGFIAIRTIDRNIGDK